MLMGKFEEAIEVNCEASSIVQKTKDLLGEVECVTMIAVCHLCLGRVEQSYSLIHQVLVHRDKIQARDYVGILLMRYSYILIASGRYKDAFTILEDAVDEWISRIFIWGDVLVMDLTNSVKLALAFDNIEDAFIRANQLKKYFERMAMREGIAVLKDAYAQVYLAQGDLEKSESSLNEAIALFQQMNSYRLGEADLTLAALRLAQGQPSAALEAASAARKIFTDIEYYRAGEAILWQAKALFALRRFPDAQTCLKESAAEFKRLQQPHHLAEAQLLHGQLLAVAGQKEKALQNMTKAKATFVKLGLKRLENEAERLIRANSFRDSARG